MVQSQVKLPNLDCWGPGESIGTQYVEFQRKKKFRIFIQLSFLCLCLLLYKMERLDMKAVEALQLCTTRGGLQCGFKGKAKRVLPTTKEENVKNVMDFCRYD